jgi:predicted RNase H-like HicB family nuclease
MQYLVVLERDTASCGVHVPDLPGCIAVGETEEEALALIREAIELHLQDMRQRGEPIPQFHQSWVSSRRGSGRDALVDVIGVSVGVVVIWLVWPRRGGCGDRVDQVRRQSQPKVAVSGVGRLGMLRSRSKRPPGL